MDCRRPDLCYVCSALTLPYISKTDCGLFVKLVYKVMGRCRLHLVKFRTVLLPPHPLIMAWLLVSRPCETVFVSGALHLEF
jgi:hypothetical protein